MNTFNILLAPPAHQMAREFSQDIINPSQSRQIYLNTLAVYATDYYLRCLEFSTNWSNSEHQDPLIRSLFDIADLEIESVGRIECRAVTSQDNIMYVPAETWEERVAYVAVKFDDDLTNAQILGFCKTPQEEVALESLESFDRFLDYLCELEAQQTPVNVAASNLITETVTNLGQWFNEVIDDSWQALEEILNENQIQFARSLELSLTRGKKIDLVYGDQSVPLALVAKITRESNQEPEILIQVHPTEQDYLPTNLQLSIEDDDENVVLQAQAREQDNWIQLAFEAEVGECFAVVITLDDSQIKQSFIV